MLDVEQVVVHANGATTSLGIDPESGRVLTHSFRGHGPNMTFGQVERILTAFEAIDGVLLPKS